MSKLYPESHVEVQGLSARYYDLTLNVASAGFYSKFIKAAIEKMNIQPDDRILDLGCGTGRNACLMRAHLADSGHITGMDISDEMGDQFKSNCAAYNNIEFKNQRIDIGFKEDDPFDLIFMSFVLHGLPHEVRFKVLKNIYNNLKPGGRFHLLDFSQFKIKEMPFHYRLLFKTFECKYAFDFVERDWKHILSNTGFSNFNEHFWFKNYVRLLTAEKK